MASISEDERIKRIIHYIDSGGRDFGKNFLIDSPVQAEHCVFCYGQTQKMYNAYRWSSDFTIKDRSPYQFCQNCQNEVEMHISIINPGYEDVVVTKTERDVDYFQGTNEMYGKDDDRKRSQNRHDIHDLGGSFVDEGGDSFRDDDNDDHGTRNPRPFSELSIEEHRVLHSKFDYFNSHGRVNAAKEDYISAANNEYKCVFCSAKRTNYVISNPLVYNESFIDGGDLHVCERCYNECEMSTTAYYFPHVETCISCMTTYRIDDSEIFYRKSLRDRFAYVYFKCPECGYRFEKQQYNRILKEECKVCTKTIEIKDTLVCDKNDLGKTITLKNKTYKEVASKRFEVCLDCYRVAYGFEFEYAFKIGSMYAFIQAGTPVEEKDGTKHVRYMGIVIDYSNGTRSLKARKTAKTMPELAEKLASCMIE